MTYHFEFDAAGRPASVKVGSQLLSKTTYNADGTVKQVDYGNEDSIQYTYDAFKRLTGVRGRWDAEDRYVYEYGANGQVARLTNDELSIVSTSEYDAANRPMRITHKNSVSDVHLYTGEVTYDQYNNLAAFKEQVGADRAAYTTTFTHDNENRPTQLDFGSSRQVAYTYDGLGRVSKRTVNAGGTAVETNYGYLAGGHGTGSTTPLVQTISQNGMTLTYTYDDAGNITSVSDGSKTVSYVYDLLGQLIRANDPYDTTAGDSGTTWVYSYDQGGNILSRAAYAFTTGAVGTAMQTNRYVYDDANWKDKLTTYNGKTIPYDAIGNPLSDGNWNLTWVDGRRLRSMYKGEAGQPGYDEITFEYNENGLRTKKNRMFYDSATGTVRQQTTEYTLHGKNIVHWSSGTNAMHFFYDAQNRPAVVVHNGKPYGYLYNLQGDVIALIDSSGNRVVEYRYDAWGRILSKTGTMADSLGTINPFRYRGYVYDGETGLYYLRSRYYKPNWARFLNADNIVENGTGYIGCNQYIYCINNPIFRKDESGASSLAAPIWDFIYQNGGAISMADGPMPYADLAVIGMGVIGCLVSAVDWGINSINSIFNPPTTVPALSKRINWETGDRNHILGGSKNHGGHDWSPFGIGPNDPNGWDKLLPLLKVVADQGQPWNNPNQTKPIPNVEYYIYRFEEYSYSIVLKLFNTGGQYSLSDAYPMP